MVITRARSGVGKTDILLSLMAALSKRGYQVQVLKSNSFFE